MTEIDYTECHYYVDGICFNEKYMTTYCEGYDCLINQLQRAKQKLEKIEEIANNNNCLKCPFSERCNYDCGNCEELKLENIKKIIKEEQ